MANLLLDPGAHAIVVYEDGAGTTTGALNVTVALTPNPVPILSTISPSSTTAPGAAFTLTATGSGFFNGSVLRWNGTDLPTAYVSATQLTASVGAALVAAAGAVQVTTFNPIPGGGTSTAQSFSINNPVPVLGSISPMSRPVNSSAFTLTLNGSGFVTGSLVRWNGSPLATTYVNATQLLASVPANLQTIAGTIPITVTNSPPGGGVSAPQSLSVTNPPPVIVSLSPSGTTAGVSSVVIFVSGSGFVSTSTVRFGGNTLSSTLVSSTSLTATIPGAFLAYPGTIPITVLNAPPGGGISSPLNFSIVAPVPALFSVSPDSDVAGGPSITILADGTGFLTTSTIRWNGADLLTTPVSATQLSAVVPAPLLASSGIAQDA